MATLGILLAMAGEGGFWMMAPGGCGGWLFVLFGFLCVFLVVGLHFLCWDFFLQGKLKIFVCREVLFFQANTALL